MRENCMKLLYFSQRDLKSFMSAGVVRGVTCWYMMGYDNGEVIEVMEEF